MNKIIQITVESAYNNAVCNDIPIKTIPRHVFGWFYISRGVILVGYNNIGYNDNSNITMLF